MASLSVCRAGSYEIPGKFGVTVKVQMLKTCEHIVACTNSLQRLAIALYRCKRIALKIAFCIVEKMRIDTLTCCAKQSVAICGDLKVAKIL